MPGRLDQQVRECHQRLVTRITQAQAIGFGEDRAEPVAGVGPEDLAHVGRALRQRLAERGRASVGASDAGFVVLLARRL